MISIAPRISMPRTLHGWTETTSSTTDPVLLSDKGKGVHRDLGGGVHLRMTDPKRGIGSVS
jgi:hypothetical protein